MSTIDKLINFCFDKYHSPDKCENCKNEKFCDGAKCCYDKCIYQIHRCYNRTKTYNCNNMALYYILKHFYCFTSEIEAAWEFLEIEKLSSPLKIASIGCGPSSELYAIADYSENNNKYIDYTFKGFDFNAIWNEIWEFNKSEFPQAEFIETDFFSCYDEHPEYIPDILIINYMLSDISKFDHENIQSFLSELISFINKMPDNSWILLNDIAYVGSSKYTNLDTAYNCFEYLACNLKNIGNTNYTFMRASFNPLSYTGLYYGNIKYGNKNLRMSINPKMSANMIYPRVECNSIQMLINKK